MTTATITVQVADVRSGSRGIDRLALRAGSALLLWAARRAERAALSAEGRANRITLERLQLDRAASAQRTAILR
jgi:hypothetical protein